MSEVLYIIGSGGFAKEVACLARQCSWEVGAFIDTSDNAGRIIMGIPVLPMEFLVVEDPLAMPRNVVVAIGNPEIRRKIIMQELLPPVRVKHITLIHPSVIMSESVMVGEGSVICAGTVLTCDINIGPFSHLNLHTTIGHDVKTGAFFTTAPGVHISGNVTMGEAVYFGTNAATVEKVIIGDDVVVGAVACVTKDLLNPGTYVGVPAKMLLK